MTDSHDHFTNPPPRRVGALAIVRNRSGAVLFAEKEQPEPEHPSRLYHPGGCVEGNEPIRDGLVRAARRKLGIELTPGRLLAVHHMYEKQWPTHTSMEGVNFLFECGVLEVDPPFRFGPKITGARWVDPDDLEDEVMWYTAKRTHAALRALSGGEVEVLADV